MCPHPGRADLGPHVLPQRHRAGAEFGPQHDGARRAHRTDALRRERTRRAGGVRDAAGAYAGRYGGVHGRRGVRGTGRRWAAVAALREQLGPLVRALTPIGVPYGGAAPIPGMKDPVAGDGGCTSNRANGTVTRDRRFANSISAIRTRIRLSRRGVVTGVTTLRTHSVSRVSDRPGNVRQLSVTCRLVRPPRARRSSGVSGDSSARAVASRSANSAAGFSTSSAPTPLGRSQTGTVRP